MHRSTTDALRQYAEARDRLVRRRPTPAFFVSERGTRLAGDNTRHTFVLVSRQAGLRTPTAGARHGRGPRLHDMRHRFAASTLLAWYRADKDVERELPKLTTYLGHVHVNETYWYLEAVPELLHLAAGRVVGSTEAGPR